jgi:microcompartment protein CcmL/EutN
VNSSLGLLEIRGFTPAMVALDAMDKAGSIDILQVELNDFYGVVIKVTGSTADVTAAVEAGRAMAESMGGDPKADIIHRPDARAMQAIESPKEVSPLIQQDVVIRPRSAATTEEQAVADQPSFALGLIETQGFTAVFEAIDSACKAANVEVLCKEKLGGGYVTVVIKGDVAAVKAAIDAGQAKVGSLGKLIAAHVIARPSAGVLSLLPK